MVGVGGQGILLATQITARAAIANGHDVKTNEVHGMAQRGGSVVAQIRFGEQVFSPLVPEGSAQVLASLEPPRATRSCATASAPRWPTSGQARAGCLDLVLAGCMSRNSTMR